LSDCSRSVGPLKWDRADMKNRVHGRKKEIKNTAVN
jgi:hypothetical protein